jgi:FkbM family methyltransferase
MKDIISSQPVTLVDVGAAGGAHRRWRRFSQLLTVGFEPDERAFASLRNDTRHTWFNTALYSEAGRFPLYITRGPTNTSMLRPNLSLIRELAYDEHDFDVLDTVELSCETLDALCKARSIAPDAIKIDTQGSELAILRGAERTLHSSTFCVEAEVEFLPLYEEQPLFTDVHAFLSDYHFQLMDLGNFLHVKGRGTRGIGGAKANLISADALYFRTRVSAVAAILRGELRLGSVVAVSCAYGYPDYAAEICSALFEHEDFEEDARMFHTVLTQIGFWRGLVNRWHFSDRSVRRLHSLVRRLIPVKHTAWLPGLGNE